MSWERAPLYVQAHDLAAWLLAHVERWPAGSHADLRRRIAGTALELVEAVSLALTFPPARAAESERADCCVARLRVLLRLAAGLGLADARQVRFASGELDSIGRMVGGWRRAARLRTARAQKRKGDGARAAPTA